MIIARGKIYETSEQDYILESLSQEINETLSTQTLHIETVISAIDALGRKIADGMFDDRLADFAIDGIEQYKQLAIFMLSRENLEFKVKTELGADFFTPYVTNPPYGLPKIAVKTMPLGTLLHIAAGNADGLPAFSLAEGLLTGNVNILKLPQADNGLSVEIIKELIKIEPALADFIYVFDTPSSDVIAIKKMADLSDGIVVWGGDAAVSAVRKFAPCGAKIIEWGHKLGFAYVSGYQNKEEELRSLAEHIISTKQLLCSSCQTIFIDTEDMADIYAFCEDFLPHLEKAALRHAPITIGGIAEITLRKYNDELEKILSGAGNIRSGEYKGNLCSLSACTDHELELSYMFGNCLVKRLPQKELMSTLRRKKGYLQTAGLICSAEKRRDLADKLARCGVTRITGAGNMSATFCGEAHDGEYALRRYMRFVNIEEL